MSEYDRSSALAYLREVADELTEPHCTRGEMRLAAEIRALCDWAEKAEAENAALREQIAAAKREGVRELLAKETTRGTPCSSHARTAPNYGRTSPRRDGRPRNC